MPAISHNPIPSASIPPLERHYSPMAPDQNKHRLLTPKEVAEELQVSQAWIRDHVSGRRKPFLPHIRIGGERAQIRFRREDIDAFLRLHHRNDSAVRRG